MRMLVMCLTGSLFVFAPDVHSAGFYKWVDNTGQDFFTNDLNKIPPEYRDSATAVETHDERVSIGERPARAAKSSVAGKEQKEHTDKYGTGEEYWRKKAAHLRLKLRDQQEDYSLVLKQLEDKKQRPNKLNSNPKSLSSLEKKKIKLEKDLNKTRRALEIDLPEEARKADAYPGWIRE